MIVSAAAGQGTVRTVLLPENVAIVARPVHVATAAVRASAAIATERENAITAKDPDDAQVAKDRVIYRAKASAQNVKDLVNVSHVQAMGTARPVRARAGAPNA